LRAERRSYERSRAPDAPTATEDDVLS
jgi:hypothetical protein